MEGIKQLKGVESSPIHYNKLKLTNNKLTNKKSNNYCTTYFSIY